MSENEKMNDGWESCPAGEITALAGKLRARRRRGQFRRLSTWTVAGTALILLTALVFSQLPASVADLTCPECRSLMAEFRADRLDAKMATSVAHHLDKCPGCKKHYDALERGGNTRRSFDDPFVVASAF